VPTPVASNVVPLVSEGTLGYELLRTSTNAPSAFAIDHDIETHSVKASA
jgi:hypothetical protein